MRQLIVESVVLALVAGAVGLVLAIWGADALVALAPANVPRLAETRTDGWVLAFTFGAALISSLLFGLAPALQVSKVDLERCALKQGGTRGSAGGAAGRIRSALVIAEIALSVVLLAGAGLLIRSFEALLDVDSGFRPERVLIARTSFPASVDEKSRARAVRFFDDLIADVRTLPGVSARNASTEGPPGTSLHDGGYWIDRLPPLEELSVTAPQAVFVVGAPGMFETLQIPMKMGRDFSTADTADALFVAVINEALAKRSFPGASPIGHLDFLRPRFRSPE